MAGTLNKVMLIGNLGTDPEVRNLEYSKIVKFPIATTERYTNREGQQIENTEWHNIVVLRKGLAEVCEQYLRKGMKVYIEGSIRTRSWQDDSGQKRYMTEINAQEMTMLTSRAEMGEASSRPAQQSSQAPTSAPSSTQQDESDDLPF
jgi:single-strand DNA-binding protein